MTPHYGMLIKIPIIKPQYLLYSGHYYDNLCPWATTRMYDGPQD